MVFLFTYLRHIYIYIYIYIISSNANNFPLFFFLLFAHRLITVIKSFVAGGKMSILSRVYPTSAVYDQAHLFLFLYFSNVDLGFKFKYLGYNGAERLLLLIPGCLEHGWWLLGWTKITKKSCTSFCGYTRDFDH